MHKIKIFLIQTLCRSLSKILSRDRILLCKFVINYIKKMLLSRDLLVDTGVGMYSLPASLTSARLRSDPSKPLDVVLTHAHFDHSGGGHQFEKVETRNCVEN